MIIINDNKNNELEINDELLKKMESDVNPTANQDVKSSRHHHHHHHESSSEKAKKKAKEEQKKRYILTAVSLVLFAVVLSLAIVITVGNTKDVDTPNSFLVTVKGKSVNFLCYNADVLYVKYGHFDSVISEDDADFFIDNCASHSYAADYNGEYTSTVLYEDGTAQTEYFTVTSNPMPANLKTDGSVITVSDANGYKIKKIQYCYSKKLGDFSEDFIDVDLSDKSASALGNGLHTFRITARDMKDKESITYEVIAISGCTAPHISVKDCTVTAYGYGLGISEVLYADGEYASRAEMEQSGKCGKAEFGIPIGTEDFSSDVMTLCFRRDGEDSVTYVIVETNRSDSETAQPTDTDAPETSAEK